MQNICEATRLAQQSRQHVQQLSMAESLQVAHRQDEESKKTPDKKSSIKKSGKKKPAKKIKAGLHKKKAPSSAEPITAEQSDGGNDNVAPESEDDASGSEQEDNLEENDFSSGANKGELNFEDNDVNADEEQEAQDKKDANYARLEQELLEYNSTMFDNQIVHL